MLEPRKVRLVRSGQDKADPTKNDPVVVPETAILALALKACQMRYAN